MTATVPVAPENARPSTPPLLHADGLTKSFPGVAALTDVSLTVWPGEVHVLLGENGAGKSTLLKALFGVHEPDDGRIEVDGTPVRLQKPADASGRGIAMVHQELSLVPQLDAVKNIVLGRERTRLGVIDWAAARREALASLRRIGFDANPHIPVSGLSIAQQQLVELARALATDARLIILDEPTASLTTQESERLFTVIRQLRASGHGIVYVSHRLKEVLDLGDRITVLRDGRLVGSYTRADITGEKHLVRLMVGRDLDALGVASDVTPGDEVLRVEGLTVPGRVRDASLTVRRGEVVGLAGMVGAGRTELVRALIGADAKSAGRVWVRGTPVRIRTPKDAIDAGIAFLPEDRKSQGLVLHMSTAANTTLLDPPSRFGVLRRRSQREQAEGVLRPLAARMPVSMPVGKLSGGTQQKVVLARWLLTQSDVFIFDEPTRGIDVGAKGEIHRLMRRLADEGKGVLMISSDLPEVLAMSDRVLVMRRGEIAAELSREEATEESVVAHAAG